MNVKNFKHEASWYSQPNGGREKELPDVQLIQYLETFLEVNSSLEVSLCSDKRRGHSI